MDRAATASAAGGQTNGLGTTEIDPLEALQLAALQWCWGEWYLIERDESLHLWVGRRRDSKGMTEAAPTPGALQIYLMEDWRLRPGSLRK